MKYLLKNGTVISGAGTRKQDVLVEGEKIIKVGKELSQPDAKVVDVSGKLLFPGFISRQEQERQSLAEPLWLLILLHRIKVDIP